MSKTQRWLVLATVSAGLLMVSVDTTVLYTALPTLTSDLQADASQKLWIINAYPLVMAGLLPGAGTLGDRIGHKRMFLTGLALFAAASLRLLVPPRSRGWTRKAGPAPSVAGSQAGELGNRLGRGAFMAENDLLVSGFEPDPPRG
ncbi:MAG: transporter, family, multidrug resistance protein [Streptosporangiaceae bacterium]|jgi:MFS family permease|nr:transporter, family, multidrug resistance protein [Streptosporangiaceae bacterium]